MDCTGRVVAVLWPLLISQNLALQVWHRAMSQSKIEVASQDYVTTPDYLSLALGFSLQCESDHDFSIDCRLKCSSW